MRNLIVLVAFLVMASTQAFALGSTRSVTVSEATVVDTPLDAHVHTTVITAATQRVEVSRVQNQFTFSDGTVISNEGTGTPDFNTDLTGIDYSNLNVPGLQQAHQNGWTGNGVYVYIAEAGQSDLSNPTDHGAIILDIIEGVAPAADTLVTDINHHRLIGDYINVINRSYGSRTNTRNYTLNELCDAYNPQVCISQDDTDVSYGRTYSQSDVDFFNNRNSSTRYALQVYSAGNYGQIQAQTTVLNAGSWRSGSAFYLPGYGYVRYWWRSMTTVDNTGCESYGGRWSTDTCSDNKWYFDANADMSRVILVGATDGGDTLAEYSNSAGTRGKYHFIVADGRDPRGSGKAGTSFAAPRVSGAAALIIHKFDTSAEKTKKIILETADDLGDPGIDNVYGHGRLNVGRALSPVGNLR